MICIPVEFVRCSLEKLPEIVLLNHKIFLGMYADEPYSLSHYQKQLEEKDTIIYIAQEDGSIVGDVICVSGQDSPDRLYLWVLAVAESHRRQGIASKLIELVEASARQQGFKAIDSKVYDISKGMQNLLFQRGYSISSREDSDIDTKKHLSFYLLTL